VSWKLLLDWASLEVLQVKPSVTIKQEPLLKDRLARILPLMGSLEPRGRLSLAVQW
jgi:hypothetical protein